MVFGVINARGVTLLTGVEVFSGVGVGDFKPINVGVVVNVRVGVTGVAVGMGVYVFVDVNTGVDVAAGFRDKPPSEQEKDRTAQARKMVVFFMGAPALRWGILLKAHNTCKARVW